MRIPYILLCTVLGIVLGSLPRLLDLHGPIPEKFNLYYIKGVTAVWGWYVARGTIGFLVGITRWPERWWLRGPVCGILMMAPLGFVSLAIKECGGT